MKNIKLQLRVQSYQYLKMLKEQPNLQGMPSATQDFRKLLYKLMCLGDADISLRQINWLSQMMVASLAELAWLYPENKVIDQQLETLLDILYSTVSE